MEFGRVCRRLFQGSLQVNTKRNWSKARQIADRLDDGIIYSWTGHFWIEFIRLAVDLNVLSLSLSLSGYNFQKHTVQLGQFHGIVGEHYQCSKTPLPEHNNCMRAGKRSSNLLVRLSGYCTVSTKCHAEFPYRALCVCVQVQVKLILWMKATSMGRGSTAPRIYLSSLRWSWVVSTPPKMLVLCGEVNTG